MRRLTDLMAHEVSERMERLLDLGNRRAIWRAHVDSLREQDVNARVMAPAKFERMVENVRKERGLESLPLCLLGKGKNKQPELSIISGHHRVRVARAAGQLEIFVLVIEKRLTRDQVVAKQLAHNALDGQDDPEVLKQLHGPIEPAAETTAERINRLEGLALVHRAQHAQRLAGRKASPAELAAIVKLEVSVANLRAFEELRELTAG